MKKVLKDETINIINSKCFKYHPKSAMIEVCTVLETEVNE
jgi:hypothetical protein